MSGALCFRDTRVPVSTLFDHLEVEELDEFYVGFPSVGPEWWRRCSTPLTGADLAVVVADIRRNRLDQILPLVSRILDAIKRVRPGEYRIVSPGKD